MASVSVSIPVLDCSSRSFRLGFPFRSDLVEILREARHFCWIKELMLLNAIFCLTTLSRPPLSSQVVNSFHCGGLCLPRHRGIGQLDIFISQGQLRCSRSKCTGFRVMSFSQVSLPARSYFRVKVICQQHLCRSSAIAFKVIFWGQCYSSMTLM